MGTAEMRVLVGIFCLVAMAAAMSPHGGACGRWSSSTCTCNPDSSSCAELAECMRSCTEQENEALLAYVRCTGSPCASATGCNVDCQGYPCHYCDNQGCCTSDTWGGHCATQNVPGSSLQVMCTGVDTSEFGYTGGSSSEPDCVDGDGNEVPFPETTCVPPGGALMKITNCFLARAAHACYVEAPGRRTPTPTRTSAPPVATVTPTRAAGNRNECFLKNRLNHCQLGIQSRKISFDSSVCSDSISVLPSTSLLVS